MKVRISKPGQDAAALQVDGQDAVRGPQGGTHGRVVPCGVNASAPDCDGGGQRCRFLHRMEPAIEENTITVHLLYELPFQAPNGEIARDADERQNADEVETELA